MTPTKAECLAKAAPALAAMVRRAEGRLKPCDECGRPSATRLCSECEHRPEAA